MIGLLTRPNEREIAAEFFELFKTPWEFVKNGQQYDVLISTCHEGCSKQAGLVLQYQASECAFDAANNVPMKSYPGGDMAFSYAGRWVPLYGQVGAFPSEAFSLPLQGDEQSSVVRVTRTGRYVMVRLGYNLFDEIWHLLTTGQPAKNAAIPTLDLHIALLRELITRSGLPLIEIPPVPEGYAFTACLTHDVDHPVLKNHCLDHTMFGFLHRATLGSVLDVCRGRRSLGRFFQNVWAACRLPFVYLGMADDPWRKFDRYMELEAGAGATYFVIPKVDQPGKRRAGAAPAKRAARYTPDEIKPELQRIVAEGGELALHGLDAWLDVSSGKQEWEIISETLDGAERGVRMHWLYFDEKSPQILDEAGFSYDSSVGYCETVGFRAGTAQAYRPLGVANLMELPLHIMDTALFYPAYLGLRENEAHTQVSRLLDEVVLLGGALVINWHDRSIAPERLWDGFYIQLLADLKRQGAWFPTACQAVAWFRKRRSITFESVSWDNGTLRIRTRGGSDDVGPALVLRIRQPTTSGCSRRFMDVPFRCGTMTIAV